MLQLDYSIPIPQSYWQKPVENGTLVEDSRNGRKLVIYLPYNYDPEKKYRVCYYKMGTNNKAEQFWSYPGYTSHFEYIIDNLIMNKEIEPTIIVSIQGNPPGQSWLQSNAYDLICYVEGKYKSYADRDPNKIVSSAPYRAIGGWSLGSIEVRGILTNELKNDFYKMFGWYDIQSGYNAANMNKIDPAPFVGCVAGSADDGGCIKFTNSCATIFASNPALSKNKAQIVKGCTHMIKYQLAYFYNAIKFFFPATK